MLSPNIETLARSMLVRIDGKNRGSGVTIAHCADRYFVLTNAHVIDQSQTAYILTGEGRRYVVKPNFIQILPKVDLAVLEFISRSRYPVASLGNPHRTKIGDPLYISGWADPSPQLIDRSYQFLVGNLSGRIDRPIDGYSLIYNVAALPGMSGGPILNDRGQLIGINGRATTDPRTGTVTAVLGIEITNRPIFPPQCPAVLP
jgi:S1-C subfamily serine protease